MMIPILIAALTAEPRSWFDGDVRAPVAARPEPSVIGPPFAESPDDESPLLPVERPSVTLSAKPKQPLPQRPPQPNQTAEIVDMLGGISLKSNLPQTLLKNAERKKLVGLSPKWCTECWRAKEKFGPENHPYIAVDWLEQESDDCPQYPAIYDPETKSFHIGDALDSWASLTKSVNQARRDSGLPPLNEPEPTRAISVGTIDRDVIFPLMQGLGHRGSLTRDGPEETRQSGSVTLTVREGLTAKWTSDAQATQIRFSGNRPTLSYAGITAACSSVTVTPETVTLHLDWVPDVTLDVR